MNLKKAALITSATVLSGFLLACGAGGAATSGSGSSGSAGVSGSSGGAKAPAKIAKVGEPARDGKFEFTVKTIKCGVHQVGDQYLNKTAQGQFCLVTVQVKNIGKQAQMFDDGDQKAIGTDNAQYSADGTAAMYANKNNETFLNEINPGNQVTGVLVFDIPANAKIAKFELHDSPFSGGVDVQAG